MKADMQQILKDSISIREKMEHFVITFIRLVKPKKAAQILGCDISHTSRIMNGIEKMSDKKLRKIVEKLTKK